MTGVPEHVKRFSMCNCLTIGMPRTYTAHGMTIDFFLKRAKAGTKIVVPYPDVWPEGHPRAFKFPKRIDTFLFSTFNEAMHSMWTFKGDDAKYSCIGRETHQYATRVPRLCPQELSEAVSALDRAVVRVWGGVLRILVLYDARNAPAGIRETMWRANEAVLSVLDWPVVQVDDKWWVDTSKKGASRSRVWFHYTPKARREFLWDVKLLEWEHET